MKSAHSLKILRGLETLTLHPQHPQHARRRQHCGAQADQLRRRGRLKLNKDSASNQSALTALKGCLQALLQLLIQQHHAHPPAVRSMLCTRPCQSLLHPCCPGWRRCQARPSATVGARRSPRPRLRERKATLHSARGAAAALGRTAAGASLSARTAVNRMVALSNASRPAPAPGGGRPLVGRRLVHLRQWRGRLQAGAAAGSHWDACLYILELRMAVLTSASRRCCTWKKLGRATGSAAQHSRISSARSSRHPSGTGGRAPSRHTAT